MLDFLLIATRSPKKDLVEIYPKFIVGKSQDLMIRGGDFYAVWVEETGLWCTDENVLIKLIDRELDRYAKENKHLYDARIRVLHMWDSETGMIDNWHRYCQRQCRDNFVTLDETLVFANQKTKKSDYASKILSYPLIKSDIPAYERLISTLYSEEERHKIEWSIGAIVSGDSKKLQKFMVLYGSAGTGKSTIINVMQMLFEGYYSVFDAKALGSMSNAFALESLKSNPLVAIQHDGDLSRIEDNTRLNSLVSHEIMSVNEKFKSSYPTQFKTFLVMGTNRPVKITDAKSGLIRRLIDVSPSGNRLSQKEYDHVMSQIPFELGGIASHCLDVYLEHPNRYSDYVPTNMLGASNDFYNFIHESYFVFKSESGTTLKAAWEMYKHYCEEARVPYPYSQRMFKEELKNYFYEYRDRHILDDGTRVRSYYHRFKSSKFQEEDQSTSQSSFKSWIAFDNINSLLDIQLKDCAAQYANMDGVPKFKWDNVRQTLSDLDTNMLHYVRPPENHIVVDFDIRGSDGKKSLDENIAAASKWPETYAELSKSGQGIHLHYIYGGDVHQLSQIYDESIEIKVFTGKSALRRQLTRCNEVSINVINSGLPLKGAKIKMDNPEFNEKSIRTMIKRNINKEYHPGTKPSIDFIHKILEDAYNSGIVYDVTDLRNNVLVFAVNSTNQSAYCISMVKKMKFKSSVENIDIDVVSPQKEKTLAFFDVEVFPNVNFLNYKEYGEEKPIIRLINPTPMQIEIMLRYSVVGFNCRRYDNHIVYAMMAGYTPEQIYKLSKSIIDKNPNCFFGEAYNLSYTDIYDFCSKKQGLKKWQIELGLPHQELGLDWDTPVPEEMWDRVSQYCDNDVLTSEATFDARKADFIGRQILADLAKATVNDTTNSLTTKIIFGNNKKPQSAFQYRDMGDLSDVVKPDWGDLYDEFVVFDSKGRPLFPGYKYEKGVSTYRGEEIGEGGYVYAEKGMYGNVAVLDVVSMHPYSIWLEQLFGEEFTQRFKELLDARVAIKNGDFETARQMLDGALRPYLEDESTAKDLAFALKIAINSVYGLTAAHFENPFNDPRNVDNIVAKRGALFMVDLKYEVQRRGYQVVHIKTDSIKIADATPEIIQFVHDFGKLYGYIFEHEDTYDKICLVNDAVFIAKYLTGKKAGQWNAVGTQFQVPYVFKTLFSKEELVFSDFCETKSVTGSLYLDYCYGLEDVTKYESDLEKLIKHNSGSEDVQFGYHEEKQRLEELIAKGHEYRFVGKVGEFTPVKEGTGGGRLVRKQGNKYYAVSGTKDYWWMESTLLQGASAQDKIDMSYYQTLADKALTAIGEYGDVDWFRSDEPYSKHHNGIFPF